MRLKFLLQVCSLSALMLISPAFTYAQEQTAADSTKSTESPKKDNKPVKRTFENAVLINNQTVASPSKKSLDFMIQHRFGLIKNEKDIFGLFASSNIRIGLTYGITDRISVAVGATKNKHLYDLQWKYAILKQTKSNSIPVSVSYYGNVVKSAGEKDDFLNQEKEYKWSNRISYFHEIMVARKINSHLSLQVAGTFSYFNIIDSLMEHQNFGASFAGRYQFSPQSSVIIDFDYPLTLPEINEPKPNLGIGFEIATSSHQFQVFVCTTESIMDQETRVFNQHDFTKKEVLIGFNITRQWDF